MSPKVLVIGLDGATWGILTKFMEEDKMQNLKKLVKNGVWGELESTIPYITLPAWISMITGKNPGKIGYVHFFMRDKNSYSFIFVRPKVEHLNPIWKLLKLGANKTSFILKIPTIPRDKYMDVYLKGEFVFNDIMFTDLEKELLKMIQKDDYLPTKYNEKYILWHIKKMEKELDLIKYLIKENQKYMWDLLISVIYSTDHLSHLFWKFIDRTHPEYTPDKDIQEAMTRYYSVLDLKLGEIIKICKEEGIIIFIVSDHGHGPLRKRVNLNKWLIEKNYMKLLRPATEEQKATIIAKKLVTKIRRCRTFNEIYQKLPKQIKKYLQNRWHLKLYIKTGNIDWRHTKAYFSGYNGININLKGREPEGIVDKEKYESLISEIIEKLKKLKDPETGKPIIKNVWRKHELYTGDFVENLPDIIIEYVGECEYESVLGFNEPYLTHKPLFYSSEISSTHKRNGIFLAYGLGIKKGKKIENAKIYDVAPTILHIFGLPIPNDMDGRVLTEIFEPSSEFAKRDPKYVNPTYYNQISERQKIRAKLGKIKTAKKKL